MLTFFAHSSSEDNEALVRSGWNDPPLLENGVRQAGELRESVLDLEFDRVYSSDLQRATQTAELAFPDIQTVADFRLREINYGALNGHPASTFPPDEGHYIINRFPGGENCLDVQSRIQEFLNDWYDSRYRIAVVAHRFTQLALEVIIHGYDWQAALERDWRHTGKWQPGWSYGVDA